jgi:hypothetical protein
MDSFKQMILGQVTIPGGNEHQIWPDTMEELNQDR